MTKCPNCGELIKDDAKSCPFCYSIILTKKGPNPQSTYASNSEVIRKRQNVNTYISHNSAATKLINVYSFVSSIYVIAMVILGVVLIISSIIAASKIDSFLTFIIGVIITGAAEAIMFFGYWLLKLQLDFFIEQEYINKTVKKINEDLKNLQNNK
jgi:hypothetical protein